MSNVFNIDGSKHRVDKVMTRQDYIDRYGDEWMDVMMSDRRREVEEQEQRLTRFSDHAEEESIAEKALFFAQCGKFGLERGYRRGWRFIAYKARFKEPMCRDVDALSREIDPDLDDAFFDQLVNECATLGKSWVDAMREELLESRGGR